MTEELYFPYLCDDEDCVAAKEYRRDKTIQITEADRWRIMQEIETVLVGGKYKLRSATDMQKSIEIMKAFAPILEEYGVRIFEGDEE